MNKEDIIRMARQAGAWPELSETPVKDVAFLTRFAELVRADERDRAMRENAYVLAEREACAKLLEESSGTGKLVSCMSAAAAIRARGQA
jgi:hypothetical protein